MSDMSQYPQNDDASNEASRVEATAQEFDEGLSYKTDVMRGGQLEMIDAAQASAEVAFDFARELTAAQTPSELVALCMTQAQKQLAGAAEQTPETTELRPAFGAANLYVGSRSNRGQEHNAIDDFVVEDDTGHLLGTFGTQMEAILWAKENGHIVQVARDGHGRDKKNPEHWRSF